MEVSLIIAAGGQSVRFFSALNASSQSRNLPVQSKLFFKLQGKPVLAYSLDAFSQVREIKEIILAAPRTSISFLKKWVKQNKWASVKVVAGGKTRAQSVLNGLKGANPHASWIMVHDGARPFVNPELIKRMLKTVSLGFDGAIAARKVVPTLKRVGEKENIVETIDRKLLWEAETPQLVSRKIFSKAYAENPKALEATDEASLLESMGARVAVVESKTWNPKITSLQDLELAEGFLRAQTKDFQRTGIGKDLHRLVPKRKLILGGIRIPFELGALGHSDGDALLHAISDAILGAMGEGDIGEWFSDQKAKYKNLDSSKILKFVLEKAKSKGWTLRHIDTVIHLEKPKLGPYKEKIRKKIAQITALKADQISIKAKTREGLGDIGRSKAVAADALVTLQRSFS